MESLFKKIKAILMSVQDRRRVTLDKLDDLLIEDGCFSHTSLPMLADWVEQLLQEDATLKLWTFVKVPIEKQRKWHWGVCYPYNVEDSYLEYATFRAFHERIGQEIIAQWPATSLLHVNDDMQRLRHYVNAQALYYYQLDRIRNKTSDETQSTMFDALTLFSAKLQATERQCRQRRHHVFKYCEGRRHDHELFADEECPICLENMIDESDGRCDVWVYKCGHVVHYGCRGELYRPCPFRCVSEMEFVD